MISLKVHLDMICTEAIEGGSQDHFFDEARNRDFILPKPEVYVKNEPKLPPIKYRLELIEEPDGRLVWYD